ncbi:MAG: hypothetical protein HYW07_09170 [Candidatus Latescibacteria bacterium]|nr:hypothetical protein [Candidatus Latescibacterota bacterium]
MDEDKTLMMDRLRLVEPSEGLPTEPRRRAELALLGGLATAVLNEGRGQVRFAALAEDSLRGATEGSCLLDLSEAQYMALQQVGGAVMVVVKDQRLIIARTTADAYTAYTANGPR